MRVLLTVAAAVCGVALSMAQVAVSWDAVGVDNKKRGGEGQGPSSAEKKKAGPPCNVCNRGGGVLVTCEHTGCRTACHPMCGASYCHALSLQVRLTGTCL